MAAELLKQFEGHAPLLDANVTIEIIMAHGARDDDGDLCGDAITHHGRKALGLCKIVKELDRVKGMADAEILLDGDYWPTIDEDNQRALLDHELHHISLKLKDGQHQFDCAGRPKLKLRKHTIEVGWFSVIAERHGAASLERIQAKEIMDEAGQYFFPVFAPLAKAAKKLSD